MRIVSVATHKERLYECFVASAKKHNIPLDVLGRGMEWRGFGWRWSLIYKHLKTLNPKEIILVTDAFDSIVLKDANSFIEEFKKFNAPIVFSTEPLSNEFYCIARYYRRRVFGKDPIINGGTYIGYCENILAFIDTLKIEDNTDDQRFLTTLYHHIKMTVDFENTIMYHNVAWRRNNQIPDSCVVTFPADGYNEDILKELGYSYEPENKNFKILIRRFCHYAQFFFVELGLVMFLLLYKHVHI